MDAILIGALVVAGALLAFETWMIYLLVRQHGRALLEQGNLASRLAAVEATMRAAPGAQPQQPQGLDVGTAAPRFALPDLDGRERTLDEFVGEPLLLTFFSTTCGFCLQMAPRLGDLPEGAPRLLLVSQGDRDEHRRLAEEHRWNFDVLLAPSWDVMQEYRASGTPTGYLLDAEGRTASDLTVGADALIALATEYATASNGGSEANGSGGDVEATLRDKTREASERARAAGLAVRDISESRVGRHGLAAGTPAPEFTLPDLEGRARSLSEFRGKRVLLVFSAPDCAPCDSMAPDLVRLHERHADGSLQIVMVGRGDVGANRAKAEEHGFGFPVLVQRSWEVSKQYEMFATPIGYLIDQAGVIAKDVALGPEPILQLVEGDAPRKPERRRRKRSGRASRTR